MLQKKPSGIKKVAYLSVAVVTVVALQKTGALTKIIAGDFSLDGLSLDGIPLELSTIEKDFEKPAPFRVAAGAAPLVENCTETDVVVNRKCGDLKTLVYDAIRMPYITRSITLAWTEGYPFILNKETSESGRRREESCGKFVVRWPESLPGRDRNTRGECDEYPMASTAQGGNNAGRTARTEEVQATEQRCQGNATGRQYRTIDDDERFLVVIINPQYIATEPWDGHDVRADRARWETEGTC